MYTLSEPTLDTMIELLLHLEFTVYGSYVHVYMYVLYAVYNVYMCTHDTGDVCGGEGDNDLWECI